mgnify:CR=1 FL=1
MLKIQTFGNKTHITDLLIVHGLFGSGRNWRAIARNISSDRQVHVVDMRNHGESFWNADNSYESMAEDLKKIITSLKSPVDVLGHSMGGKASMVLAAKQPELIRRLVIADIAPVTYGHSQIRYVTAMQATDLAGVTRRSDADIRLAETVDVPALRSFFLQSLDLKSDPPKWRLNLEVLGQSMAEIMGFPEVDGTFDSPTLMLSGADSDYVSSDHRPRIKTLFPNAKFAKIPGAGHWLHAEKPREFVAAIAAFLDG